MQARSALSDVKRVVRGNAARGGRPKLGPRTHRSHRRAAPTMAVDLSVPLDELISSKLGALSLREDEEMVDFVKGLVEEESFEPEVRKGCAAVGSFH